MSAARLALLAALALTFVAASASPASATWWGQFDVQDPTVSPSYADTAISEDGTATVVWSESTGGVDRVRVSRFAPNSDTANDLGYISPPTGDASDARVAVNSEGTALVVWERDGGPNQQIEAASIDATSMTPQQLGTVSTGFAAVDPQVDASKTPDFTIVWSEQLTSPKFYAMGQRFLASGPAGLAITLATGHVADDETSPVVAVDEVGVSKIAWQLDDSGSTSVQTTTLSQVDTLSPQLQVSTSQVTSAPVIASTSTSVGVIAWSEVAFPNDRIAAATVNASGTSTTSLGYISNSGIGASQPAISVSTENSGGDTPWATAAWVQDSGPSSNVFATAWELGTTPATGLQMSDGGNGYSVPAVVTGRANAGATIAWRSDVSGSFAPIQSKVLPRGSTTPSTTYELTDPSATNVKASPPALVLDEQGLAFVAWSSDAPALFANRTYSQANLAPTSLDFGNVPVGSTAELSVVATNTDVISPLNLSPPGISPSGPFSWDVGNCEIDGFPGDSCTILIRFSPDSTGDANATFTFPSNARTPMPPVPLTGNGVTDAPPDPTPTPTPTPTPKPDSPKPCNKVTTRSAKPVRIKPTDHTGAWAAGVRLVAETSGAAKLTIRATGSVNINGQQRKITFRDVNNMTVSKQRRYGLFPTASSRRYTQLGKRVRLTLKTTVTPLQSGCTAISAANQRLTSTVRKIVTTR